MTLCLHQPRPLTARAMPDHDPAVVHVFHRGQKRTRNARGIWKSHSRQSAAQRRDRSESAAHHVPHHRRSQSSSVASSSTTTWSFGRTFDDADALDRYGDGDGDELDLEVLSLHLHSPDGRSQGRRTFKRQRRSLSREEPPAAGASAPGRVCAAPLRASSDSPRSSSATLSSCALPQDANFPSGPGMNIPLPVPLHQRLSDKRTKTFCEWRDWEDLKHTFASAAEDCECASLPHLPVFYRSTSLILVSPQPTTSPELSPPSEPSSTSAIASSRSSTIPPFSSHPAALNSNAPTATSPHTISLRRRSVFTGTGVYLPHDAEMNRQQPRCPLFPHGAHLFRIPTFA